MPLAAVLLVPCCAASHPVATLQVQLLNPLQMLREAVNLPALCPAGITSSTQDSSALIAAGTGASPSPPSPAPHAGRAGSADQAATRLKQAYERMLLEQQARHQQERERLQQKFDQRIKDMVRLDLHGPLCRELGAALRLGLAWWYVRRIVRSRCLTVAGCAPARTDTGFSGAAWRAQSISTAALPCVVGGADCIRHSKGTRQAAAHTGAGTLLRRLIALNDNCCCNLCCCFAGEGA